MGFSLILPRFGESVQFGCQQEMYYGMVYYSYEELETAIRKYITYYNEKRIKEKLGWLSQVQYRLSLAAA